MYNTILLTLDTTPTDRAIIGHVKRLAAELGSRVMLLHVLDGWAARRFGPDAVTSEVPEDSAYLAGVQAEFAAAGVAAEVHMAYGDPVEEIVKWTESHACDLVAMSTHGHRGVTGLIYGKTASRVQHRISIPVLMLRAK